MGFQKPALLLFVLASAGALQASAQVRAGGEFQVNAYTTGDQAASRVAVAGTGDFVVIWASGDGIFSQRYDPAGAPLGSEFRVDASTSVAKSNPGVAADRRGHFVVSWLHSYPASIRARRFDATGQPVSGEIAVEHPQWPTSSFEDVRLTGAPDGAFAVTYLIRVTGQPTFGYGFSWFQANGVRRCSYSNYGPGFTGVAARIRADDLLLATTDAGGRLQLTSVAWFNCLQSLPLTFSVTDAEGLDLATDIDGNAVAVWTSPDGDQRGIYGRRFDAAGNASGPGFLVGASTAGNQSAPSVSMARDGAFQVAWQSTTGDGSGDSGIARRYTRDGTPREGEFVVNTYTTGAQRRPAVATDASGSFVVTWDSEAQDGSGLGVLGQRFAGIRAVGLAVDAAGNGVLEADETVTVAPSWLNASGAARSLNGLASSFTGPGMPGSTYLLADATADYGVAGDGATASCAATGDCYQVMVSGPRPAVHWDARLLEDVVPGDLGLSMPWSLHVGESFPDVPRTSPFYRFVETLLHAGVTGGCGSAGYCPEAAVTREQMPVFVLRALNPERSRPPGCFPLFNDVPWHSPFCPWIEELARRGVVAGCGGGNYCPQAPVTREQMAVFVLATLEGPGYAPPACVAPPFADVPAASPFCRWIQELALRGVVGGCGGANYCPASPVTRDQMSVFLTISFGLQLYGP